MSSTTERTRTKSWTTRLWTERHVNYIKCDRTLKRVVALKMTAELCGYYSNVVVFVEAYILATSMRLVGVFWYPGSIHRVLPVYSMFLTRQSFWIFPTLSLHRCCRGHGIESRSSLSEAWVFFWCSFSNTRRYVHKCDGLSSSLIRRFKYMYGIYVTP